MFPPARSGVRSPSFQHGVDRRLDPRRLVGSTEAVAQHQRRREEGGERVRDAFAGDVGGGAVDRLEEAGGALDAEAGAGEHPEAAGQHRRLVAEDVAEEVLGDDHVELGRAGNELHRGVVDEQVVEGDVVVLGGDPGHDLAPEPRRLHHVRLVDRGDLRLVARSLAASAGGLECGPGDPLDFRGLVLAGVEGGVALATRLAEVDAAGELADDQQVGAGDAVLAQRAGAHQRRARPHRAQVRVEAHAFAQAEQALLGARVVGVRRVPFGTADRTEEDRIGGLAGVQHLIRQGDPVLVDRAAAHQPLVVAELAERVEHFAGGADDLGTDPVSGEDDYLRGV